MTREAAGFESRHTPLSGQSGFQGERRELDQIGERTSIPTGLVSMPSERSFGNPPSQSRTNRADPRLRPLSVALLSVDPSRASRSSSASPVSCHDSCHERAGAGLGDVERRGAEAGDDFDVAAQAGDVGAECVEADVGAMFDLADPGLGETGGDGELGLGEACLLT